MVGADLNGVGDDLGSLLLGQGGHIFQQDCDLNRTGGLVCVCGGLVLQQGKFSLVGTLGSPPTDTGLRLFKAQMLGLGLQLG